MTRAFDRTGERDGRHRVAPGVDAAVPADERQADIRPSWTAERDVGIVLFVRFGVGRPERVGARKDEIARPERRVEVLWHVSPLGVVSVVTGPPGIARSCTRTPQVSSGIIQAIVAPSAANATIGVRSERTVRGALSTAAGQAAPATTAAPSVQNTIALHIPPE